VNQDTPIRATKHGPEDEGKANKGDDVSSGSYALCVPSSVDVASLLAWPGTVAREKAGTASQLLGRPGGQGIKHGVDSLEYSIDRSRRRCRRRRGWKRYLAAGVDPPLAAWAPHVESRRRWRARSQIFPSWLYRTLQRGFPFSHGRGIAECGPSALSLSSHMVPSQPGAKIVVIFLIVPLNIDVHCALIGQVCNCVPHTTINCCYPCDWKTQEIYFQKLFFPV
jgi:hypothetical protein